MKVSITQPQVKLSSTQHQYNKISIKRKT